MVTLTEFLETANADDTIALSEAQAYTETKLWRIEGKERKTQVKTAIIVNDTLDRLTALMQDNTQDPQVIGLAKAILTALNSLYEPEFYINLNDPTVKGMFDNAKALGVLNTQEADEIEAAATYTTKPFEKVTLHDVMIARNTVPLQLVTVKNGLVVIELPVDVESYNPRIIAYDPILERNVQIGTIPDVSKAGKYKANIPFNYASKPIYVDDLYGNVLDVNSNSISE